MQSPLKNSKFQGMKKLNLFLFFLLTLFFISCNQNNKKLATNNKQNLTNNQSSMPVSLIGSPAPEIKLKDLQNKDFNLSQLKNKIVLLNFFASWCETCKIEMPVIEAAYRRLKNKNFVVIGINLQEKPKQVIKFLKGFDISYLVVIDKTGKYYEQYGLTGVPESFLIDKKGIVREKFIGEVSIDDIKVIEKEYLK